uniref:Ig-like domain-containing protein n=1 Tax=Rhinolophus ferrumequinum TaxID=59479 RepID=A0A671EIV2_RHIFE
MPSSLLLFSPALTQTPNIHFQGTLESGHPKNITCTVPWACERGKPPTFSWIGVNLTFLGPRISYSSVVTLTPGPQDHGTNLTCRVTLFSGVKTERTIRLNVSCESPARTPGRLGPRRGVVQGAVGGAGVTALLALCLFFEEGTCVPIMISAVRQQSPRPASVSPFRLPAASQPG